MLPAINLGDAFLRNSNEQTGASVPQTGLLSTQQAISSPVAGKAASAVEKATQCQTRALEPNPEALKIASRSKKITAYLLHSRVPEEEIRNLFDLFDGLEKRYFQKLATVGDVEGLVQRVLELLPAAREMEHVFLKGIRKLAKSHKELLPFCFQVFKEAEQSQEKYACDKRFEEQIENSKFFATFLRTVFIFPMLFGTADSDKHACISKHLGKVSVPLVTGQDESDSIELISRLDAQLEAHYSQRTALQVYCTSFRYLNKGNQATPQPTFSYYLAELIKKKNGKISPRLMFVPPEVTFLFTPGLSKVHLRGLTLAEDQTIILSTNDDIKIFLKSLIHEMQHLYNALFFEPSEIKTLLLLSRSEVGIFLEFARSMRFANELNYKILEDLAKVLNDIACYNREDQSLDELSAHLSSLLLDYSPDDVRDLIYLLLRNSPVPTEEQDNGFFICAYLSEAFILIENSLKHMTTALDLCTLDKEAGAEYLSRVKEIESLSVGSEIGL